jgi:hypothetical protein
MSRHRRGSFTGLILVLICTGLYIALAVYTGGMHEANDSETIILGPQAHEPGLIANISLSPPNLQFNSNPQIAVESFTFMDEVEESYSELERKLLCIKFIGIYGFERRPEDESTSAYRAVPF